MTTLKTEQNTRTPEERMIYELSRVQLMALRGQWTDDTLIEYIDVCLALYELDRLHEQYNKSFEMLDNKPHPIIEQSMEDAFSCTISIGRHPFKVRLAIMTETDFMYEYLNKMKMNRFNELMDSNITPDDLIDTLSLTGDL